MKCPVCGALNESDAAFCYSCGSDLRGAKEVKPTPRPIICSVCGALNESDALFCSSCGNDLKAKQKKSKLWIVFLVIGLVLVLGAAIAAFFIFGGEKKPAPDNTPTVTDENPVFTEDDVDTTQDEQTEPTTEKETEPETEPETEAPTEIYYPAPEFSSALTLSGSELAASNVNSSRTFVAANLIDGNNESCWCVNTSFSGGVGAKVKLNLAERTELSGFYIENGNQYLPDEGIYRSNGQAKAVRLTFSDGSSETLYLSYYDGGSIYGEQIYLPVPVVTDYVILEVLSSYEGVKYTTNVCITEIEPF